MGLRHMGCPVNQPESCAVSCCPLSLFQEQEWVHVSGEESGPRASLRVPLGSQHVRGCNLLGSSQGCSAQCMVCMGLSREDLRAPVPSPRLGPSRGLSPDLMASLPFPPSSMGTVLYSLGVDEASCWCCVFSEDVTLMCSWGS